MILILFSQGTPTGVNPCKTPPTALRDEKPTAKMFKN